jgi:hypothetical protein
MFVRGCAPIKTLSGVVLSVHITKRVRDFMPDTIKVRSTLFCGTCPHRKTCEYCGGLTIGCGLTSDDKGFLMRRFEHHG